MTYLTAAYAWCAAHPELVLGALLFVAANVFNRLQAGPAKAALARVIDRLSALNRAGADKPLSLPLIGRSTFDAVVTPAVPAPIEPRRGFAAVDALAIALGVGALAFTAVALSGCPLAPPDMCTPRDTRCAPDGIPEVCSSTQRWTRGVPAEPCPSAAQCCRTMSPWGRALHACVPATACIPESPVAARDGGAE